MKWGLICNSKVKKSLSLATDIYDFLQSYGEVFSELSLAKKIKKRGYSFENINKNSDIIITIGGDGTILRALRVLDKPIFAINSGGMGFLSEVESKYAIEGLKKLLDGKYNIEERSKLKIMLDGERLPDATNEVTIQTAKIAKIMYYQILVENELLETIGADGVILSTPTGSTSYALSVGGPILDPALNAILIAPIAPFRLSARPWVVPLNKIITLKVLPKSKETKIVIDGQYTKNVTADSKITITGSEKTAKFILKTFLDEMGDEIEKIGEIENLHGIEEINVEEDTIRVRREIGGVEVSFKGVIIKINGKEVQILSPENKGFGYEAAKVTLMAIEQAGLKDRTAILEEVSKIKDFDGVSGIWSFDQNGDTTLKLISGHKTVDGVFVFEKILS